MPYPSFNTIVRHSLPGTWDIGMHCNPSARENRGKTAPNNIPYSATMREVGARIRLQQAFVEGCDWAGVDGGSLGQVVVT